MMGNRAEIRRFITELKRQGGARTWAEIAELATAEFGEPFTSDRVRKVYYRAGSGPQAGDQVHPPGMETMIPSNGKGPAYRQYFDWIREYQEIHREKGDDESVKTHQLHCERDYVLVVFSADWHLGNYGVDYGEVESLIDFVADTPDVYLISVGDLIDNFRKFRSAEALFGQIPPNDQLRILESVLERLGEKGKHIASTWGNHDVEFDEKLSGFSYAAELLRKSTHYFKGIGKLILRVNEQEYIIGLTHYYKGHSIYNPVHSHTRFLREQFPDCDIVATGHKHFPAAGWWPNWRNEGAKIQYLVQVGSPKLRDGYSGRYYGGAISGNHYFFFHTRRRQVVWMPFEDAALEFWKKIKSS